MSALSANELPCFSCSMGLIEIKEDEMPICMVDFGKTKPPITKALEKNKHFYVDFRREKEIFIYYILGDYISGASEKISFFFSFEADQHSHERFQKATKNSPLWLLIVRTSADTNILIEKSTGEIKKIYETPRS